jgi:hypothetical protein
MVTIVLLAFMLLNQACQSGKLQVEYVFPDGFKGPVVIREHQPDGIAACEVPWLPRTEVCVLNFPASGTLNTQGDSPTKLWHIASARYANGTVIPVPNTPAGITVAKDEVAVWYGQGQQGEGWLFVGTGDEFTNFQDEKNRVK